jgi:hypothetical protein
MEMEMVTNSEVKKIFPQFLLSCLHERSRRRLVNRLCEIESMAEVISGDIVCKYDAIPLKVSSYEFSVRVSKYTMAPQFDLYLGENVIARGLTILELVRRLGEYK